MCGIVGMVAHEPVNQNLYDALTVLQHRGQDAAGIITCEGDRFILRKDNGMVRDVFQDRHMEKLRGNMGLGHVRYPTAGSSSAAEAQPFYVNSPYGIALAHNGNLTNDDHLKREMSEKALRHVNTTSDSEILLNVLASELQNIGSVVPQPGEVFAAITNTMKQCFGGYAAVAMITGYGVLGFRDPWGIRPLVYGKRQSDSGMEYMIASESVALDVCGFELVGDVRPGEGIYITAAGELHRFQCLEARQYSPCIFEYVYLARPDSVIDGISVYESRLNMGRLLGLKVLEKMPDHGIDAVVPIPDTSRTSAVEVASTLNVPLRDAFIKNRYIGRTFIMPGQTERRKSIRRKLNPITAEFKGRNVLLVDDSIVRGNTMKEIVQMTRDSGANKVYVCSASPAVRYPNVYGIDMPSARELAASGRTDEEMAEFIGADALIYQSIEDLVLSIRLPSAPFDSLESSVFDGNYITNDVDDDYLDRLDSSRNDDARQQQNAEGKVSNIDLFNSR